LIKPDDNYLVNCRLFNAVDSSVINFILNDSPQLSLRAGQHLFERGDEGGKLYIVLSGRVEVYAVSESGRKISLNFVPPGECIGEISMFDNFLRSASVVAQEDTLLQPISKTTFVAATAQSHTLALNMIEILCERFRWASNAVEDFAILSLERRLARRLLLLDERFADDQGEISITQNDLADFVGASREATNKVLMHWKAAGLIDIRRGSIKLQAMDRLDLLVHEGL
jgi:CRP/FNR family transcriptional regulator, cyclic AMP receptor protein